MSESNKVTNLDLEEIASLIKEGNTSGVFSDGDNLISWNVEINKSKDQ